MRTNKQDRPKGASVRSNLSSIGLKAKTPAQSYGEKEFEDNSRRRRKEFERITKGLEIKNKELIALNAIIEKTNRVLNLSEVINSALEGALEALEIEAGVISLLDEVTKELIIHAHRGLSKKFIEEYARHPTKAGEGIAGKVALSGEPIVVAANVAEDPGIIERRIVRLAGLQLIAAWPLRAKRNILGVMSVMSKNKQKLFSVDLNFLAAIGSHIGIAIENAWLYEKSGRNQFELQSIVKELEARNKELEERNKELESFSYTVSHDLKNPLVSIRGFVAELFKEYSDPLGGDGRFYLNRIAVNAERMEHHIHDLLELAKVRSLNTILEEIDLKALLKDVLDELEYQIKQVEAEVVISEDMPKIISNRSKLRQVFINLIDNALKYAGHAKRPRIEIGFQKSEDSFIFYVKDDGAGIPVEYHQKIFNIFERLPETKMLNPEGTGVGLAIVKKIVELQGGAVWVESEPGKGATFYFSLAKRASVGSTIASQGESESSRVNALIHAS